MERKKEEQARWIEELQGHAEVLQRENDQLRTQIENSHDLGKEVRDGCQAVHPIARNRGKEPVIPDDVDTPIDDELSSGSSPSLSRLPTKNSWESAKPKSLKRPSYHPASNDAVSGASRRVRRDASRR